MTAPLDITTARLRIRWLTPADAGFVLQLVNDADWLRFIGDRAVQDLDGARRYIESGPAAMYRAYGFGLNRVALKEDDRAIGICGLLRRDGLDDADLGFALLPEYRRQGFAREAARAILEQARQSLGLPRVAAIVNAQNADSICLLSTLGFTRRGEHRAQPGDRPLDYYAIELGAPGD